MCCQPTIRRSTTWPPRSKPKSRSSTASLPGSEAWVFVRRRNSSLIRSSALVVRSEFHCEDGEAEEGEEIVARFLERVDHRLATEFPLAGEGDARLLHRLATLGVD